MTCAYSVLLSFQGRHEEALALGRTALAHDPMSPYVHALCGANLYRARRHDDGIASCRRALELDATAPLAILTLALNLAQKGDHATAIAALEALSARARMPAFQAWLALVLGHAGRGAEAERVAAELAARAEHEYVPPLLLAAGDIATGRLDAAFDRLEDAFAARDPYLLLIGVDPMADPLRESPRLPPLLERLGLTRV
jgi:tetratricopeptide (TPR) repeat protein